MELPNGWTTANWSDVVVIIHGQNQKDVEDPNGIYPIYGSGGQIGKATKCLCKAGSTVVGRKGTINRPFFTQTDFWNIDTAFGITPREGISPKFLFLFCVHFNFHTLDHSTGRPSLTQTNLYGIKMPLPPLAEQHRIVTKIDALFSKLDKGVEMLQTIRQQLRTYRQAVLKWAFEGDKWEMKPLEQLGDLGRGKSKHRPRNDSRLFTDGKYPFIQTGAVKAANSKIKEYDTMYGEFGLQQSKLWPVGTLCITIAANIADTAFLGIEACFPDSVVGFTANEELVLPKYIDFFIQSAKQMLWYYAPATAQKNINLTTLENLMVPYCSLDEQAQIVADIESRLSVCDKLETLVDESFTKAEALRQSILKKAFAGQLVPQDSSDESAEKLLERIKALKEETATTKPARRKKNG